MTRHGHAHKHAVPHPHAFGARLEAEHEHEHNHTGDGWKERLTGPPAPVHPNHKHPPEVERALRQSAYQAWQDAANARGLLR